MPSMGIAEYARHRKCALNAVQVAILSGRIKRDANGRIDSEQADRDWETNTLAIMVRPGPKQTRTSATDTGVLEAVPGISYMQARGLREVYAAQAKKIEVEEREKTLIPRREVEAEAFRSHRLLRDACFNIPPRLSSQLAAESDPLVVHRLLEDELRQIFAAFSEGKLL